MTLELVEPTVDQSSSDRQVLLREAAAAIFDLRDVEDRHLRSMFGSCLTVAETRGIVIPAVREANTAEGESLSFRLGRAMGAIDRLVATYDPFYPDKDSLLLSVFEGAGTSLKRGLNRLLEQERHSELEREARVYRDRWRESDLPRDPELSHTARRRLVGAGVWQRAQIAAMSDAELLAIKGIGPKSLAQLRSAVGSSA